ncbi:MAG: alpha/beta fold hydrolase [Mariprofundaceae bacterium]
MKVTLIFLHGWGQSSKVWFLQTGSLASEFEVLAIDLPGHGKAAEAPAEQWLELLARQLPEGPLILVGWSLGAMLSIQLAHKCKAQVVGLVLVAATPCFRQRADWPHACTDDDFSGFERGVVEASARAMSRYFSLMFHGDAISRSEYNLLVRKAVDRDSPAGQDALAKGLDLLSNLDLRKGIQQLEVPCLLIHGENDAVVPLGAGKVLEKCIPDAKLVVFPACGHAPFLTQAERFNQTLEDWCRQRISIESY